MASFKAKFPVLQELFAKNHMGALWPPPPSGARINIQGVPQLMSHPKITRHSKTGTRLATVFYIPIAKCL